MVSRGCGKTDCHLQSPPPQVSWNGIIFFFSFQISVSCQGWMDGWHITVGIQRKRREASCQNHSLSLFVIRPRAAGKCFSEHTLVLSLRKPDLEVTSRSNCTSAGIQILKGVKEMSGSLCLGSWVDSSQASHGPKKLSGCLAVQSSSGQCIPDGLPAFFGFGASWSSRAVSQGSLPEGSGQLSRWEGPG